MNAPSTTRRRSLARLYGSSLIGILILGLLPGLSLGIAILIANVAGCELDEGSVHACLVFGVDLGDTLYAMSVLGWLMIVSIPLGGVLLACWIVVLCVHLRLNRLRKRTADQQAQVGERM
jgi:hypothetical protein